VTNSFPYPCIYGENCLRTTSCHDIEGANTVMILDHDRDCNNKLEIYSSKRLQWSLLFFFVTARSSVENSVECKIFYCKQQLLRNQHARVHGAVWKPEVL